MPLPVGAGARRLRSLRRQTRRRSWTERERLDMVATWADERPLRELRSARTNLRSSAFNPAFAMLSGARSEKPLLRTVILVERLVGSVRQDTSFPAQTDPFQQRCHT